MIHKQLVKQLRSDALNNLIFSTGVLAILSVLVVFISAELYDNRAANYSTTDYIQFTILFVTPIFLTYISWKLIEKANREVATQFFIGAYCLLITYVFVTSDSLNLNIVFLYSYFIIISSTLVAPPASFGVWLICTILVSGGLIFRGSFVEELGMVVGPTIVNLFLATAGFFTTLDWQEAVQSTSILHLRAQRRRDELFTVQDELRRSNIRQKSLYTQLITSVEVGQRLTTVLHLDDLLQEVVNLINEKLSFAYVGIFILEDGARLTIRAQAGLQIETGPARKSRLALHESNLLTEAAKQQQDMITQNIRSQQFPAHPYLSKNTQSEIGLPLVVGEQLYGVLNIQSYGVNAFSEENMPILRLLANQVAIAMQNAQLFEAMVQARGEAEQANEIKSRFLANMSHELRTPLNAILNFTGFVADGIFGSINEEQADALEKTLDSGAHLLSLINDILDLAKVEAGVMDMFIQDIDVNHLLQGTASTAKGLLKNKAVDLILDINSDLPRLPADARRLRQVMLNLVSNAVKFTKEGNITISAAQERESIRISVQDTGVGIAPDDQELIFESFHQAQTGLNSELGTGLGLPIAKHFVEAHGGQIWLESQVGRGTTFYIKLPLQPSQEKQPIPLNPTR